MNLSEIFKPEKLCSCQNKPDCPRLQDFTTSLRETSEGRDALNNRFWFLGAKTGAIYGPNVTCALFNAAVVAICDATPDSGNRAEIGVLVDPRYQQQEYGTKVVTGMARNLKKQNIHTLIFPIDAQNIPAQKMAEKLGALRDPFYRQFDNENEQTALIFVYHLFNIFG